MNSLFIILTLLSLLGAGSFGIFAPHLQVGQAWAMVHFGSLQIIQPVIERYIAQWLWDPVFLSFLTAPLWGFLLVLGIIFYILSKRSTPQS
jgi:hypothetical protein